MNILIFKTDIKTSIDFMYVRPIFDRNRSILNWSIDLEDKDCVLRIEAIETVNETDIQRLLKGVDIICEPLPE